MILASIRTGIAALAVLLASALLSAPSSLAQDQQQSPKPAAPAAQAAPASGAAGAAAAPAAPAVDPAEEAAYKAITDAKPEDSATIIPLGEAYVQKYPTGKYAGQVYSALAIEYEAKQDLPKMYATADKALAINPDDVRVLVVVGWVIPHHSDSNDLDAESQLDKAEKYEKHALELLPTLPKPANLTDEQFAKLKGQLETQAHSGLGLVYFRRQNFADSITELQKATADPANLDPTDLYVMGFELTQLKRFAESADAFQKCAAIPGGLQDRCKQMGADAKKQAASQPAPK
ncbi:MAG: hypothetical protein WA192_19610 [Candidatus Acidiferrales bacterium]